MSIIAGPFLGFRGIKNEKWQLCVVAVTDTEEKLNLEYKSDLIERKIESNPKLLKNYDNNYIWLWEFGIPQFNNSQIIHYFINNGPTFEVYIPTKDEYPRISYASCNGFSDAPDRKKIKNMTNMWKVLKDQHETTPIHFMLMGGDQIYADEIWTESAVPSIYEWTEADYDERIKKPFTVQMQKEVEKFYFNLYCKRWSNTDIQNIMSRIPTLMMWDDHDIFDGWGSYEDELNMCPVYQGIFKIAKEYFRLFQLKVSPDELPPEFFFPLAHNFSYSCNIGDTMFLVLDLRSERTQEMVMKQSSWDVIYSWLDSLAKDKYKHLIVVSGIPVVFPKFNFADFALKIIPGRQELEDDLKDQWTTDTHNEERLRLIYRLLKFAADKNTRVTILSGDVHVGALGVIESSKNKSITNNSQIINQLISSGIIHPSSSLLLFILENLLGKFQDEIDRGIVLRMLEFPGTHKRFIGERNFLILNFDKEKRIWANWFTENQKNPYIKAINPVGDNENNL